MWSSDEKIQRYRPLPYDARDGGLIEAAAPGHMALAVRAGDTDWSSSIDPEQVVRVTRIRVR